MPHGERPLALIAALLVCWGEAVLANDKLAENGLIQTWVSTSLKCENVLIVSAGVTAAESVDGQAEMIVVRNGAGGSLSTRQASEFSLIAGQSTTVGTVSLNISAGGTALVTIIATKDGITLSEMELSIPEIE